MFIFLSPLLSSPLHSSRIYLSFPRNGRASILDCPSTDTHHRITHVCFSTILLLGYIFSFRRIFIREVYLFWHFQLCFLKKKNFISID